MLNNLEKIGILRKPEVKSIWPSLHTQKNLNLINTEVDFKNPNDSSYAYNGYTPTMYFII